PKRASVSSSGPSPGIGGRALPAPRPTPAPVLVTPPLGSGAVETGGIGPTGSAGGRTCVMVILAALDIGGNKGREGAATRGASCPRSRRMNCIPCRTSTPQIVPGTDDKAAPAGGGLGKIRPLFAALPTLG